MVMSKLQAAIDSAGFDTLPIEQVYWLDSMHFDRWRPKDEHADCMQTSVLCRTVGYVAGEDGERISFVQSEGAGSFNSIMQIPKVAIISRRLLAHGKEALNASHGHSRKI